MAGTIGLSFIFRDNAATIERALNSILPYVDEVVAVDTGSLDGTREIVGRALERRTARSEIVDFEWIDDFAAARNAGWERARGLLGSENGVSF